MPAKRRRSKAASTIVFPPRPEPPRPGFWRVMQKFDGAVLQWAWTCPACKTTEYVHCEPPRAMELDGRRERCSQADCVNRPSVLVQPEPKVAS